MLFRLRLAGAVLGTFLCGAMLAHAATISGPAAVTISEDGTFYPLVYDVTNNSASAFFVQPSFNFSQVAGDPSDTLSAISLSNDCPSSLGPGLSCSFTWSISAGDGAGETDSDFGQFSLVAYAYFVNSSDSATTTVTVLDPTPLPAALPLFATGLGGLGLLGWRRKRKSRVSLLGAT